MTTAEATAPVVLESDVVVCGGGSAGIGAALAAARAGVRVALVERWPFFGGNATAASIGSICGLYVKRGGSFEFLSNGIAREWAEALGATGSGIGPIPYKETAVMPYVPWGYKRLADKLLQQEESLTLLLHSFISGVVMSGRAVEAVVIATKKGPRAVRGRVFVDATGDADIAFQAGGAWEMGEAGRLQYPSMQFVMQNVDLQAAMAAGLATLNDKIREGFESGSRGLTRAGGAAIPTMRPGEVVGAMTRVSKQSGDPPDGTDVFDLTESELAGRTVAESAARFLVEEMPGFASSYLQDTAMTVGIRETRHALGDHVVTFEEAAAATKHPDGIAASAWPFEFHTEGADTRWEFLPDGEWFEIPYRSLLVRDLDNVLVAGRCVSATHEALASSRVTGVCMAIGEAAGLAAASCIAEDNSPREIDPEKLRADLVGRGVLASSK